MSWSRAGVQGDESRTYQSLVLVRTVDASGDVLMVARRLEEVRSGLVDEVQPMSVVGAVLGEVEVLGSVLLDELPVLVLHRLVMLKAHIIVDLIRIVRNMSDRLDVISDSAIKPCFMIKLAEHVFLIDHQLL